MAKYRFTDRSAGLLEALGFVVIALSVVGALVVLVFVTPPESLRLGIPETSARIAAALAALGLGVLFGGPLIVLGQLLHLFLDQRRWLARIHARLRRWEEERTEEGLIREATERARRGRMTS